MANQKKVDETKEAAASACAALKAAQKAYDAAIKAMKEAANAALEYEDKLVPIRINNKTFR